MPSPIFVRPRFWYDSYTDYWRLVELAGFPTCYEDEFDAENADATYILTMLNLGAMARAGDGWKTAKARLIYWDLEWSDESYVDRIPGLHEFWTSDRSYAAQRGYTFVPLGSHPRLVNVNPTARWNGGAQWDVSVLAYMGPPRRQDVWNELGRRGLRLAPTGAWGDERERQLEGARVLLNIHQHDAYPCVAAQRFALAAAAAIPLISETIADPYPFEVGRDFVQASKRDLPAVVEVFLAHGHGTALAANMLRTACEDFRFERNVMRALDGGTA